MCSTTIWGVRLANVPPVLEEAGFPLDAKWLEHLAMMARPWRASVIARDRFVEDLVVGQDHPWDVRAYYANDPAFQRYSTSKQLYNDEDFEVYRELGHRSTKAMLNYLKGEPIQGRIIRKN